MNQPEATRRKTVPAAAKATRRVSDPATRRPGTRRTPPPPLVAASPADEDIRQRAYEFYLERGGAPGDPLADWLRAERELLAERCN